MLKCDCGVVCLKLNWSEYGVLVLVAGTLDENTMVSYTRTNWSEFSEQPPGWLGLEYLFPQGKTEEWGWLSLGTDGFRR